MTFPFPHVHADVRSLRINYAGQVDDQVARITYTFAAAPIGPNPTLQRRKTLVLIEGWIDPNDCFPSSVTVGGRAATNIPYTVLPSSGGAGTRRVTLSWWEVDTTGLTANENVVVSFGGRTMEQCCITTYEVLDGVRIDAQSNADTSVNTPDGSSVTVTTETYGKVLVGVFTQGTSIYTDSASWVSDVKTLTQSLISSSLNLYVGAGRVNVGNVTSCTVDLNLTTAGTRTVIFALSYRSG